MDLVFSKPQAYLKLQIFDPNNNLLSERKQLISENALNAWETLSLGASIPQNGKIKVFLVNETAQEAYFDELEIVISNKPTTKIVQENNYYPFGLNMRGLEKVGSPDDKFQYNAQTEKDEDIEMYETPFRGYYAVLGRFHQVDLLAPLFPSITPFHFGYNNPVYFNDPSGLVGAPMPNNQMKEMERKGVNEDAFKTEAPKLSGEIKAVPERKTAEKSETQQSFDPQKHLNQVYSQVSTTLELARTSTVDNKKEFGFPSYYNAQGGISSKQPEHISVAGSPDKTKINYSGLDPQKIIADGHGHTDDTPFSPQDFGPMFNTDNGEMYRFQLKQGYIKFSISTNRTIYAVVVAGTYLSNTTMDAFEIQIAYKNGYNAEKKGNPKHTSQTKGEAGLKEVMRYSKNKLLVYKKAYNGTFQLLK